MSDLLDLLYTMFMNDQSFKDETIIKAIKKDESNAQKVPAIQVLSGPAMGKLIALDADEFTVGRSDKADLVINDDVISRFHCKFITLSNNVQIEDLKSANGTFVNGEKVSRCLLQKGDKIKLSDASVIKFDYVDKMETDSVNRLYDMAVTDGLTGAHTKRYFLDQLNLEFAYAKRRQTPISLILFDIDFFKKINDTYGHIAGDMVLKKLSETTRVVIRKEDVFARYGGEEFAILMRDTNKSDAIKLAERLRLIIEFTQIDFENKAIPVTISLGVATLQQNNYIDAHELIKASDQYLYAAKNKGRNRVMYE